MIEQKYLDMAITYLKTPECQQLLKDENIYNIYENKNKFAEYVGSGAITQVLLDAGIDPFRYTKIIPQYGCPHVEFPTGKYVIPNNINEIEEGAFASCENLTHLIIPSTVTTIDSCAFLNCTNLTVFNFPANLQIISSHVLKGCSNLKSIYVPVSVTQIAEGAFENCENLKHIEYGGPQIEWHGVKKQKGWNKHTGHYVIHCADGDIDKT